MKEHTRKLQNILERLEKANIKIQPEKCVFATDMEEYVAHICTPQGIRPDPKNVEAFADYPVPKTVKDVRSFVVLAGYYKRHVSSKGTALPGPGITRSLASLSGVPD